MMRYAVTDATLLLPTVFPYIIWALLSLAPTDAWMRKTKQQKKETISIDFAHY